MNQFGSHRRRDNDWSPLRALPPRGWSEHNGAHLYFNNITIHTTLVLQQKFLENSNYNKDVIK